MLMLMLVVPLRSPGLALLLTQAPDDLTFREVSLRPGAAWVGQGHRRNAC